MEPGNKLEVLHRRDGRKNSPNVSASIGSGNPLRTNFPRKANKIKKLQ